MTYDHTAQLLRAAAEDARQLLQDRNVATSGWMMVRAQVLTNLDNALSGAEREGIRRATQVDAPAPDEQALTDLITRFLTPLTEEQRTEVMAGLPFCPYCWSGANDGLGCKCTRDD